MLASSFRKPRVRGDSGGKLGEWNRKESEILAELIEPKRFLINDNAARLKTHHVFACGIRIHRNQEIDFLLAGNPAIFVGANRKPGGKACNVGREEVLAADRYSHLEYRSHKYAVGRLTAGAVDRRNLNAEVVHHRVRFCSSCCSSSSNAWGDWSDTSDSPFLVEVLA